MTELANLVASHRRSIAFAYWTDHDLDLLTEPGEQPLGGGCEPFCRFTHRGERNTFRNSSRISSDHPGACSWQ